MSRRWDLRGRLPIEPLDDERLARIERAVVRGGPPVQRPAWSRSRLPLLVAVAAMAAALTLIAWRAWPPGEVELAAAPPVRLHTDALGTRLALGDATVLAGPGTDLEVTRPGGGVLVELRHGRVELEVAKRGERPPLVVRADDVEVIVVGTRFTVDHPVGHDVEVEVTEGVVRVERDGVAALVRAGEHWRRSDGLVALTPATADGADPTEPSDDGAAVAPPPTTPPSTVDAGPSTAAATPPTVRPPTPRPPEPPLPDLATAIRRQSVPAAVDVGETNPARALAIYQRRLGERGEVAAAALYGMARLQALSLGRTSDALRSLDAYLARFPSGAETKAVLWLRIRLLCDAAPDEACRAAAHSYLRRDPDGGAKSALALRITHAS
ncbi:MAG: FecR domain-containing protein [Kofleriaceae bacterium]